MHMDLKKNDRAHMGTHSRMGLLWTGMGNFAHLHIWVLTFGPQIWVYCPYFQFSNCGLARGAKKGAK